MSDTPSQRGDRYLRHLYSLVSRMDKGDPTARAAIARLRRGLGRPAGAAVETLPEVLPYIDAEDARRVSGGFTTLRDTCFLIGGLLASHPEAAEAGANLGATLHAVGTHESAERRMVALLNARRDQLPELLRQAIALASSARVPVNYRQLFQDVLDWEQEDRRVQLRWASYYWPAPSKAAAESPDSN